MREFGKEIELADLRPFDIIRTCRKIDGDCLIQKIKDDTVYFITNINDPDISEWLWLPWRIIRKPILVDTMSRHFSKEVEEVELKEIRRGGRFTLKGDSVVYVKTNLWELNEGKVILCMNEKTGVVIRILEEMKVIPR